MKNTSTQYLGYEDVKVLSKPSIIGVFDKMNKECLYSFMRRLSVTEVHTDNVFTHSLMRFIPRNHYYFHYIGEWHSKSLKLLNYLENKFKLFNGEYWKDYEL